MSLHSVKTENVTPSVVLCVHELMCSCQQNDLFPYFNLIPILCILIYLTALSSPHYIALPDDLVNNGLESM
jgi:hypothetical protein